MPFCYNVGMKRFFAWTLAGGLFLGSPAEEVDVSFAPGAWNTNEWTVVKSPRWSYCRGFVQKSDGIENACPSLPSPVIFNEHASDVYSAMVHKTRTGLGATVSSSMQFDHRMAPLIVLAESLDKAPDGTPQFGEHWEVVLYDQGLNVWHHFLKDGKPAWYKAAFLNAPFAPNTPYRLEVKVVRTHRGQKEMTVSCGGHVLGFANDRLPESFQAGIIGCEGRNRFHDFRIR